MRPVSQSVGRCVCAVSVMTCAASPCRNWTGLSECIEGATEGCDEEDAFCGFACECPMNYTGGSAVNQINHLSAALNTLLHIHICSKPPVIRFSSLFFYLGDVVFTYLLMTLLQLFVCFTAM